MTQYRYIFADLLTNSINIELPLFGVSFDRQLNVAGNFNGSFKLDTGDYDNQSIIEGTMPGRTALYIEREDRLVWGGIIWSRTYQEASKTFQYTAQTFESFFKKQDIRQTLTFSDDQRNILIDLIAHMQQDQYADIQIQLPGRFPQEVVRNMNYYDYQVWTYGKAIDELVEYDEGFDYTIEAFYTNTGVPAKRLLTNTVLGSDIQNSGLTFDYPGNISNFWFPENASNAVTDVHGVGAGEDVSTLRSRISRTDLLNAGYPRLVGIYSNTDISRKETLDSRIAEEVRLSAVPITSPSFQISTRAETPKFGSYNLGDWANVAIDSARFPNGTTFDTRIIGWKVSLGDNDAETINLTIEGAEEMAVE